MIIQLPANKKDADAAPLDQNTSAANGRSSLQLAIIYAGAYTDPVALRHCLSTDLPIYYILLILH